MDHESPSRPRLPTLVAAPSGYRPHLDGIRTLAVYLVVAFHTRLGLFSGGFIGVDVFFVLSGFLVTSVLVRDLTQDQRPRWGRFYARRVRRILPAAIATLLVTALVYAAIATPNEVLDAAGAFRAAFLYVANWYFIRQSTDYFAANIHRNPVLHFWSLAVEEQFYIAWPLALAVLHAVAGRARRWRWPVIRAAVLALAVASAVAAWVVAARELDRAYYGSFTRAYQPLTGAVIALTPQLLRLPGAGRASRWGAALAFGAIVLLATPAVDVGPISRGILVALCASALIIALENATGGALKRAIAVRPVTYLGRISYGTYLWHWPLVVFLTHGRQISAVPLFVLVCVGATTLAALSFRLLEHPIRVAPVLDGHRGPVIAIGLACSIIFGLLVGPAVLGTSDGAMASAPASRPRLLDWRAAKTDMFLARTKDCLGAPLSRCTAVRGTGLRVLLIGDSHAGMWAPTFIEIARQASWTLSLAVHPGCLWQRGLAVVNPLIYDCPARQADWYERLVPELDPDLVILVGKAYDDPHFSGSLAVGDGATMRLGDAGYEEKLIAASAATLRDLRKPGRRIVMLEPIPLSSPFSPLSCLSSGTPPDQCTFTANTTPSALERYYREASRAPDVWSLDLDRLVCPRWPTCDPIVNDIIVRQDEYSHLTKTYARSLAPRVAEILRGEGIVGER